MVSLRSSVAVVMCLALVGRAHSSNMTAADGGEGEGEGAADTCGARAGLWGALLEDWATAPAEHSGRHGRIMVLPPANGYYVTERIDGPFVPPPPARPGPPSPPPRPSPPAHGAPVPLGYTEWEGGPLQPASGGKIVNRPPAPYKDKFKPSYAPPTPGAQGTGGGRPQRPGGAGGAGAADRVDAPPGKQVSETDLYLLGAIEKLVYRADLMEKRLRRLEESVHYLVAGADTKPEPCEGNYTRVGSGCYQWSREAVDWKGASVACRRQGAALVELLDQHQRRVLLAKLLSDDQLRGDDFWTGGLNPGLLWIWSGSARPVEAGSGAANSTATIPGAGRCLALAHEPAARLYALRGRECGAALRYVCQRREDDTRLSNDIQRAARSLRLDRRRARLLWEGGAADA